MYKSLPPPPPPGNNQREGKRLENWTGEIVENKMYAVTLSHGPVYSAQLKRMVEANWLAREAITVLVNNLQFFPAPAFKGDSVTRRIFLRSLKIK